LANSLIQNEPAWAATIFFYAAMHRLDEYLSFQGIGYREHTERIDWLKHAPGLSGERQYYLDLYHQSRTARYECPSPTEDVCRPAQVRAKMRVWYELFSAAIDREEQVRRFILPPSIP